LLDMQPSVVQAYLKLVKRYHPELLPEEQAATPA
jgi:curved DNA-binding protein CbpA